MSRTIAALNSIPRTQFITLVDCCVGEPSDLRTNTSTLLVCHHEASLRHMLVLRAATNRRWSTLATEWDLVHRFDPQRNQVEHLARAQHRVRKMGRLRVRQPAQVCRHQSGRCLVVGNLAACVSVHEVLDLLARQLDAIPFLAQDLQHARSVSGCSCLPLLMCPTSLVIRLHLVNRCHI